MNWEERYRSGHTPWDLGRAHPELERRLADGWQPEGRVFVPGCGSGHDALAFAQAGHVVTAVDLVDVTDGRLDHELGAGGGAFNRGDALAWEDRPGFGLMWDHTFFCAIEPDLRQSWVAMVSRVIRPGGILAGISFPKDREIEEGGPPWGMSIDWLVRNLNQFQLAESSEPRAGIARRAGREHWYTFIRV